MKNPLSFIFHLLQINKEKIVFSNFDGRGYGCNPKYITEELLRRGVHCKIIWLSDAPAETFPDNVQVKKWNKILRIFEWSTAKIIVNNVRMGKYFDKGFHKKNSQIYIQTWHGSMGIKKMEADCKHLTSKYIKRSQLDSSKIDYLLSNSTWLSEKYRSSFFYSGEIIEEGSPRNDLFFSANRKETANKIKQLLGISSASKVALYAPTFRDGNSNRQITVNLQNLKHALENKFGGDWKIALRPHPNQPLNINEENEAINVAHYPDPQELLLIADCLITDYSSAAYDFMLLRRPVFLFVPDYDNYLCTRGLYYPLAETPFSISKNNAELSKNIESFNQADYTLKVNSFLKEKGSRDCGHASKAIVDIIIRNIGK